jgi:hypothetical protein
VNRDFYFDVLYPLQDRVLGILSRLETGFYLSGGTAASRGPADVARRLCIATRDDWKLVRWIEPPDPERYVSELVRLGEKLIL